MLNWVVNQEGGTRLRLLLIDYQQSGKTAEGLLRSLGIDRPALLDRSGSVAQLYGVSGLPVAVFVTAQGQISAIQIGQLSRPGLVRLLQPIMSDAAA
jgi:hypothetical protein